MPFFLSKKIAAQITTLCVMEYLPLVYVQSQRTLDKIISKYLEESKNILSKSRGIGKKNGISIEIELSRGDAVSNIIDYSKKENFDTIIMGRRGMGKLNSLYLAALQQKC
jgi:nucleotide-binding universal stress UspA family protein